MFAKYGSPLTYIFVHVFIHFLRIKTGNGTAVVKGRHADDRDTRIQTALAKAVLVVLDEWARGGIAH